MQGLIPREERYRPKLPLGGGRQGKMFKREGLALSTQLIGKNSCNTFRDRYAKLEQGKGHDAYKLLVDLCNNIDKSRTVMI